MPVPILRDMNQILGRPVLDTSDLALGQELSISWTSCGALYRARGPVVKINRKSIKVKLSEAISGYPVGFQVHIDIPGSNLNGAWYR